MERQMNKRRVQVIQPTIHAGIRNAQFAPVVRQRVAAYARVSTGARRTADQL